MSGEIKIKFSDLRAQPNAKQSNEDLQSEVADILLSYEVPQDAINAVHAAIKNRVVISK